MKQTQENNPLGLKSGYTSLHAGCQRGGGAGSVGGNASGTTSGAGGAGLQNSFRTGSNEWYSVGGRGGIHTTGTIIAHTTGYGGPGSGGGSRSTVVDDDLGDAGENGIVVIRYLA